MARASKGLHEKTRKEVEKMVYKKATNKQRPKAKKNTIKRLKENDNYIVLTINEKGADSSVCINHETYGMFAVKVLNGIIHEIYAKLSEINEAEKKARK